MPRFGTTPLADAARRGPVGDGAVRPGKRALALLVALAVTVAMAPPASAYPCPAG